MAKHGRIGKFTAQPGQLDALVELMLQAARIVETSAEGCDIYLITTAPDESNSVWVVEVWDTKEAADAALNLDAVRELIPQVLALVAPDGPSETHHVDVQGGKGLTSFLPR